MSSSLAKPSTAPVCWTSRNDQSVRVVYCSHSVLTCLCTDGLVCCRCAGAMQETLCLLYMCCPRVLTFAVNSLLLFISPFLSPLDLLHKCRTCSVSKMPWQRWICYAQIPQQTHAYFWLGTMDRSVQVQPGSFPTAVVSCKSGTYLLTTLPETDPFIFQVFQ